jgi:hypothetical protein
MAYLLHIRNAVGLVRMQTAVDDRYPDSSLVTSGYKNFPDPTIENVHPRTSLHAQSFQYIYILIKELFINHQQCLVSSIGRA